MSNQTFNHSGHLSPRERKALAFVQLLIEAAHNPEALQNVGDTAKLALDIGNNYQPAIDAWIRNFKNGSYHDRLEGGHAEAYQEARNAGVSGLWLDSFYDARNESKAGV